MAHIKTTLNAVPNNVVIPAGATKVTESMLQRHICLKDDFDLSAAVHYAMDCILLDQNLAHEQGKKHVVLVGEEHATPSNKAFQAALLTVWADRSAAGDFMIGDEVSHMALSDGGVQPEEASVKHARMTAINSLMAPQSPLSASCVTDVIAREALPYFHVDASSDDGILDDNIYLNAADDRAQKSYGDIMGRLTFSDDQISAEEALGMAVRNGVHVDLVSEYMQIGGYKSACLLNGADHILGHDEDCIIYQETLTNLFRQRGYVVTPIIIDIDVHDVDADYYKDPENLSHTVAIDGMNDTDFNHDERKHKLGLGQEKQYLKRLQDQFAQANDGQLPFRLPAKLHGLVYYEHASDVISKRIKDQASDQDIVKFTDDIWNGFTKCDIS